MKVQTLHFYSALIQDHRDSGSTSSIVLPRSPLVFQRPPLLTTLRYQTNSSLSSVNGPSSIITSPCSSLRCSPSQSRLSSKQAGQNALFSWAEQLRHGDVFLPGAGVPAVSAQGSDLQDRAVPQHREAPFCQTTQKRQLKHLEPNLLS